MYFQPGPILLVFLALLSHQVCGFSGNGYRLLSIKGSPDGQIVASLEVISKNSIYGPDLENLQVTVSYQTQQRIRVRISDSDSSDPRWEIPDSIIPRSNQSVKARPTLTFQRNIGSAAARATRIYSLPSHPIEFSYTVSPFGFALVRKTDGNILFNSTPPYNSNGTTKFGPMVFKDQYLEISTQVSQYSSIYGLGESTRTDGFRLAHKRKYALWAADIAASVSNINLYGSFPFYLEVKPGGISHGVLLLNSNGMDVLYDEDFITYKVIGGILDFYFFAGPTPISVVQQYTELVGRPAPVPYWSLGFHQCKYGYESIKVLEDVVAKYKAANIPLEVMWSDIDHMDEYRDFTLDPKNYPVDEVQKFVKSLHESNQKYIIIIDPGIKPDANYPTYERGLAADVYIKDTTGKPYLGQVWPGPVYFPDFLNPKATAFWTEEISIFHKTIPFDGLWIDMNEASNFCSGSTCTLPSDGSCPNPKAQTDCCLICSDDHATKWDNPPYLINNSNDDRPLGNKTIATSARHYDGTLEYDVHNLYGLSEAIVTHEALKTVTGKRPFVLSRSTFVGSGRVTAHWTGDNAATWNDLAYSIVGMLNSGLFGIPMVGSDICGFGQDTTEELCNRWIQLGAFYPFTRDHSDNYSNRQELYLWESVTRSAKKALGLRYRLLPYLYTLFLKAHKKGSPVARPLFFEFPRDAAALGIDTQFMLGRAVMVSPVLTQGATSVDAYIPKGTWYNLFNPSDIIISEGSRHNLTAPLDTINVHVLDGSIIPMQEVAMTTALARKTPFTLMIAFSSESGQASALGELFLDDGERIEMELESGKSTLVKFLAQKNEGGVMVRSMVYEGGFASKEGLVVENLVILGVKNTPSRVTVDGVSPDRFEVKKESGALEISELRLDLSKNFLLRLH